MTTFQFQCKDKGDNYNDNFYQFNSFWPSDVYEQQKFGLHHRAPPGWCKGFIFVKPVLIYHKYT